MNKDYEIHYLPLFQDDLMKTVYYISNILENPDAALKLVDDVEKVMYILSGHSDTKESIRAKPYFSDESYQWYSVITHFVQNIKENILTIESILEIMLFFMLL